MARQEADQKPEGAKLLREKFRAARRSNPGCSSAHRLDFQLRYVAHEDALKVYISHPSFPYNDDARIYQAKDTAP